MTFNKVVTQFLYSKNTDSSTNFVDNYNKKDIYNEIQQFMLPITYLSNEHIYPIQSNVKDDLELISTHENSKCIYDYALKPTNVFGESTINLWSNQITDHIPFLKDTQIILKNMELHLI